MVDICDDAKIVRRRADVTGVVRRRRGSDEEKGWIVAEAIAPDAVIADVVRHHDLVPQHLWNWIKAAREGRFALPCDGLPAFVAGDVRGIRAGKRARAGFALRPSSS
jgi:transposase